MAFRALFVSLVLGSSFFLACGGEASNSGDGDGDGDGPTPGDGDGDGDGPLINSSIEGRCSSDADCVPASVTNDACYSPGCELPRPVSLEDLDRVECLVEWEGLTAPTASADCDWTSNGGDVACPAACAQPPTCIHAYCDAGTCALSTTQDGSDCTDLDGGTTEPTCDALDQARDEALMAARACVPDGVAADCTAGMTILSQCGCPVMVNDNQPSLVEAAQDAYDAWSAACEPPMLCQLIDCIDTSGMESACQVAGEQSLCVFQ